jgi:DNA-binding winged helix-turn-helix (wHTH) protein
MVEGRKYFGKTHERPSKVLLGLEFGPYTVIPDQRLLLKDRIAVPLTPTPFEILLEFVRHPGVVLSKDHLMKAVWPGERFVEDGTLTRHISTLRQAIGDGFLKTIPRVGWRFVSAVTECQISESSLSVLQEQDIVGPIVAGDPPDSGSPPLVVSNGSPLVPDGPSTRQKYFRSYLPVVVIVAVSVLVVAYAWRYLTPPLGPVTYRVAGDRLQTFDGRGRTVWEFRLPGFPIQDRYAEPWNEDGPETYQKGLFADIDDDGVMEFLFVFWPKADDDSPILYCFRSDGSVAWTTRPGRTVTTAYGATVMSRYWPNTIRVLKRPRPDGGRIIVGSHHYFSWTQQVAVYTASGKQVAEYWHPGWLFKMAVADLDGDGVEEIILGGVNDGFRSLGYEATIVVLDSRFVSGQGAVPEDDLHQIKDVPPGRESAVLLFQEFDKNPKEPDNFCRVEFLKFVNDHLEAVIVRGPDSPYVHYQLDRKLQVASITPSQLFEARLLTGLTPRDRADRIQSTLGRIKVLRNKFALQN